MPTVADNKKVCKMLVRDYVPEIISTLGYKSITRTLDHDEYLYSLVDKIKDETRDIKEALRKPSRITEELSDLQEIIDAIADYHLVTKAEIQKAQANKRRERGGFEQRIFLEEVIEEKG